MPKFDVIVKMAVYTHEIFLDVEAESESEARDLCMGGELVPVYTCRDEAPERSVFRCKLKDNPVHRSPAGSSKESF